MFLIAAGLCAGEALGLQNGSVMSVIGAAVFTSAILYLLTFSRDGPGSGHKKERFLVLVFILLGLWRGSAEVRRCGMEAALGLDGVNAEVTGKIERIRKSESRAEVLIRPDREKLRYLLICLDGSAIEKSGELSIGMKVAASGRYSPFTEASNPGQFDYRSYYRAQKLSYRFFADELKVTDKHSNLCDRFRELLRRASCRLADVLDSAADPADAGVLRSVLLGDKSGIDNDIRDLYQKNGIAHLLAISGLHLSLISAAVYGLLRRSGLGFGLSGFLGGAALIVYCVMSGASLSSLRALIMILLSYTAAWLGRTYDLLSALGLAAAILFFDSPYELTQSGALLSFLAVLGIAAVLEKDSAQKAEDTPIARGGWKRGIIDALTPSLGIQMVTAPVILWNFFSFPLYGILINLFVLPLMGCVIASGAAGALAGVICLPIGRFFLGMAHYILLFYDLLCRFFMSLPASGLLLGRPSPVQIGIYYGILFFMYLHGRKIFRLLPLFLLLLPLPVIGCNVLFMDVGQGDGILIRSHAATVLVDGGSSSVADLYTERLLPCLESQAVSKIDYAIVSHCDSDHTSGLYMLLNDESPVRVKRLILPAAGRGNETYEVLRERGESCGAEVMWMQTGDFIDRGKLRMTCIYPDDSGGFPDAEPNEHSLVLTLDYGGFSMLLTGDMSRKGEEALLARADLSEALSRIQVLKVAHHGSASASSGPWLDILDPRWAIISCGLNNRYHHPAPETVTALDERDITVYATMDKGAISLWTDGRKIRWSAARPLS